MRNLIKHEKVLFLFFEFQLVCSAKAQSLKVKKLKQEELRKSDKKFSFQKDSFPGNDGKAFGY